MEEYLKCFGAWYRTGLVYYIPYAVFEYQNSISRSLHEYELRRRIGVKYGVGIKEADGLLDDFEKALNKCFDKYLENLAEDYSNFERLSVNLSTLRLVESGDVAQWMKYVNSSDKSEVKKFERYVKGEF